MGLKFRSKYVPKILSGIGALKIVTDSEGNPVINPTRAILAQFLDNVTEEGDEIKYTGKAKLKYGYTDLISKGGKQRISQEDYDKLPPENQSIYIAEEEIDYARINILVESTALVLVDDGKGIKVPKEEKVFDILEFKMFDAKRVKKDGNSLKVFNNWGSFAWVGSDEVYNDRFKHSDEDSVRHSYLSQSILGFEELIGFLFSYTSQTPNKDNLLEDIDFEAILKGDVSSIINIISEVHENFNTSDGKQLYGALGLFMPVNNNNTNNMTRQEFYPCFEQLVANEKGEQFKDAKRIKGDIRRSRKPSKVNGKIYDPESKGYYIGEDGIPTFGVVQFDEKKMDVLKASTGAYNASTVMPGMQTEKRAETAPSDMVW